MTREKAKEYIFLNNIQPSIKVEVDGIADALWISRYSVVKFVDTLYDDIESRICENCNYLQSNAANDMFWCINQDGVNKYRTMDARVDLDFGCNKFECKPKQTYSNKDDDTPLGANPFMSGKDE